LVLYIKATHIVFIVTWFAGLFYLVRLFVYHVEAEERSKVERDVLQDQFRIMERRIWYGIAMPSMVVVTLTGLYLLHIFKYHTHLWMQLKLGFFVGLMIYHHICGHMLRQLKNDTVKYSSTQLRVWNEVATLFLVSIVFLVVLKDAMDFVWGVVGFVALAVLLMVGIRIYRTVRGG
tara:strand:+ start:61 stop:588 length:528 start_codon:yes stop_codon:yes gene_type:complete